MSKEEGSIDITSGVSLFTGKAFCTVMVNGKAWGQLEPSEVRTMALHWLEAAEAAEMDAIVLAQLREDVGLDMQEAGAFILALRRRRSP